MCRKEVRIGVAAAALYAAATCPSFGQAVDFVLSTPTSALLEYVRAAKGEVFTFPHGSVSLVDIVQCSSTDVGGTFLALVVASEGVVPVDVLSKNDCDADLGVLVSDPRMTGVADGVLKSSLRLGPGVTVLVTDFSANPNSRRLSDEIKAEITGYTATLPVSPLTIELTSKPIAFDAELSASGSIAVLTGKYIGAKHLLLADSIPTNRPSDNFQMTFSHDAVSTILTKELGTQRLPIRAPGLTNLVATKPTYRGQKNSVEVTAQIESGAMVLQAAAKWNGGDLLLSNVTGKSLRSCSGSGISELICQAKREAEDAAANVAAATALQAFAGSPLRPIDPNHNLPLGLGGWKIDLRIVTNVTSSSDNGLTISATAKARSKR